MWKKATPVNLAQVVYSKRELHQITNFAGMLSNAVLSKALKRILHQSRPADRCQMLGICHSTGMPSSHAQMMWFVWTLHMVMPLRYRLMPAGMRSHDPITPNGGKWQLIHLAENVLLFLTSSVVSFARVYLSYHTMWQVRRIL